MAQIYGITEEQLTDAVSKALTDLGATHLSGDNLHSRADDANTFIVTAHILEGINVSADDLLNQLGRHLDTDRFIGVSQIENYASPFDGYREFDIRIQVD